MWHSLSPVLNFSYSLTLALPSISLLLQMTVAAVTPWNSIAWPARSLRYLNSVSPLKFIINNNQIHKGCGVLDWAWLTNIFILNEEGVAENWPATHTLTSRCPLHIALTLGTPLPSLVFSKHSQKKIFSLSFILI